MALSELPAEAADVDTVPGAVLLIESEHILRSRHGGKNKEIILVPAPANDPDDPLNWVPRRRILATMCMLSSVLDRSNKVLQ
jgi:hypothetical protein